jgi:hypothetical protein
MKLSEVIAALFPLRTALQAEIDYLKSQLAQERRRVDVLQEGLIVAKRPSVLVAPSARVNPAGKPKPVGWEATRAEIRNESREAEPQGLSQGADSGSADTPDGDGLAA